MRSIHDEGSRCQTVLSRLPTTRPYQRQVDIVLPHKRHEAVDVHVGSEAAAVPHLHTRQCTQHGRVRLSHTHCGHTMTFPRPQLAADTRPPRPSLTFPSTWSDGIRPARIFMRDDFPCLAGASSCPRPHRSSAGQGTRGDVNKRS